MSSPTTTTSNMVKIVAPSDLPEGYVIEAQANGKTIHVTVPPGGVKAGQEFEAALPSDEEMATMTANNNNNNNATTVTVDGKEDPDAPPTGRFKNELCDCCDTCPCPFFMGWCCPAILAGQVFQRLKYNFLGQPSSDYQNTCIIMTCIFLVAYLVAIILAAATGAGAASWCAFSIYLIIALTLARNNFRKKYNIPGSACGDSALDDCCCAYWCSCCTIIQMHRHTHNEQKYRYDITSKTGLPPDAPEIV